MYYTVEALNSQEKNISQISRELGIDRKTVRKILSKVKDGVVKAPEFSRKSKVVSLYSFIKSKEYSSVH